MNLTYSEKGLRLSTKGHKAENSFIDEHKSACYTCLRSLICMLFCLLSTLSNLATFSLSHINFPD